MKFEFVIWGCGKRGRNLCDFLVKSKVKAFIESNTLLHGKEYRGIPIISFEEFKKSYPELPIFISPLFLMDSVKKMLDSYGIKFFSCDDLPPEILEMPVDGLRESISKKLASQPIAYLYGINAYSLLLANEFTDIPIRIIPELLTDENIKYVNEWFPNSIVFEKENVCNAKIFATSLRQSYGNNKMMNIYDFSYEFPQYYNSRLEVFKNAGKDKRCFIIGTGPSLEIDDLNKLKENNELCISMNGIHKAFTQTDWRPDYYLIQDVALFNDWKDELKRNIDNIIVADLCLNKNQIDDNFIKFHLSMLNVHDDILPKFSSDFAKCVYWCCTITYAAIQFAVYLGCKDIYLLGIDFNYNLKSKHFIKDYSSTENNKDDSLAEQVEKMRLGYEAAQKYALENGINIMNATRGGKLEVFKRVDFDTLF